MTKRSKSKTTHENQAFQILFLKTSGMKLGSVWRLQLPVRTAGVNV